MRKAAIALALFLAAPIASAQAWWDEGHMQVAYLAYGRLEPAVKDKVDTLLKVNKQYDWWTAGAPNDASKPLYAFVHAATWADDIKEMADYRDDKETEPNAGKLGGYTVLEMHKFWHYRDIFFSPDGTETPKDEGHPNAVSQLKLMIAALPQSAGASEDIRSYSLVWMLHLVGDLHQPLHAAARVTVDRPHGDQGGNLGSVVPADGEKVKLHAYWDRQLGGYSSVYGAIFDATHGGGVASIVPDQQAAEVVDPDRWVIESEALAEQYAYAAPVLPGAKDPELTRDYEKDARKVSKAQVALAGARLAKIINDALR